MELAAALFAFGIAWGAIRLLADLIVFVLRENDRPATRRRGRA